ncbi:uncharacterized protein [Phaseolus vulgaris]|uniref:uncharacterized protein isoform X1 n=2 Tax=Phaseolus vulgaris TaxID=3885 RepID=UPI0035CCA2C9
MIVMIQYIQDLISWKSVCPHHFPTLGHIFSLLHHYECCVHCLSPKQLALFLCREGCGSYMHQAHSSSCSLSSLVKPHNFCGLFTLAVDKGGLSYAIRYPRQLEHMDHLNPCFQAQVAREDNFCLLRQNGHDHMPLPTTFIASIIQCLVISPVAMRKTNGILSVCLQYSIAIIKDSFV